MCVCGTYIQLVPDDAASCYVCTSIQKVTVIDTVAIGPLHRVSSYSDRTRDTQFRCLRMGIAHCLLAVSSFSQPHLCTQPMHTQPSVGVCDEDEGVRRHCVYVVSLLQR